MDEEKQEAEKKIEATPTVETNATLPEETGDAEKVVTDAKDIVDGMKEANKKKEELLEREERLQAKKETLQALGGGSDAGTKPEKPVEQTDTEYAEALERGEVNPLKDDGILK